MPGLPRGGLGELMFKVPKGYTVWFNPIISLHPHTRSAVKFGHKSDARFSSCVQMGREESEKAIRGLLSGSNWWLVITKKFNGKYYVGITVDHCMFYIDHNMVAVPKGKWQDFWEPDQCVTKKDYTALPTAQRAAVEAILQGRKRYAEKGQFIRGWLEFYRPKLYEDFWWTMGANLLASEDAKKKEQYDMWVKGQFKDNYVISFGQRD